MRDKAKQAEAEDYKQTIQLLTELIVAQEKRSIGDVERAAQAEAQREIVKAHLQLAADSTFFQLHDSQYLAKVRILVQQRLEQKNYDMFKARKLSEEERARLEEQRTQEVLASEERLRQVSKDREEQLRLKEAAAQRHREQLAQRIEEDALRELEEEEGLDGDLNSPRPDSEYEPVVHMDGERRLAVPGQFRSSYANIHSRTATQPFEMDIPDSSP